MGQEGVGLGTPGWSVLVVDDEENLNWSLVTSLRRDNFIADGALSGEEALRRLAQRRYDFIVSDVKMPGMDGFELLEYLRRQHPNTRVVMMTAFGSPSARQEAFRGGVVAFLEKPFDLRVLKAELRRLASSAPGAGSTYDVLDIAQVINLTRRDVTLVISNSDVRGELRFDHGELVWAGSETLRGEPAFYMLAVPRALSVVPQARTSGGERNITAPLSRLLFQALTARSRGGTAPGGPMPGAPANARITDPRNPIGQTPGPAGSTTTWSASAVYTTLAANAGPVEPPASRMDEQNTASMAAMGATQRPTVPSFADAPSTTPTPMLDAECQARVAAVLEDIVSATGNGCGIVVVGAQGQVLARADQQFKAAVDGVYAHLVAAAQSAMRALLLADWDTLDEARLETPRVFVLASRLGPGDGASLCILAGPRTGEESEQQWEATTQTFRERLPEVVAALR